MVKSELQLRERIPLRRNKYPIAHLSDGSAMSVTVCQCLDAEPAVSKTSKERFGIIIGGKSSDGHLTGTNTPLSDSRGLLRAHQKIEKSTRSAPTNKPPTIPPMTAGRTCSKGLTGSGARGWNFEIFMKAVRSLPWSSTVGYPMLNRGPCFSQQNCSWAEYTARRTRKLTSTSPCSAKNLPQ